MLWVIIWAVALMSVSNNSSQQVVGHSDAVRAAAFSPDSHQVVTASKDTTAIIWNISTCEPLHILQGHEQPIGAVAYHPRGLQIVTASHDSSAIIWNAATGGRVMTLNEHTSGLTDVAYSPDGRQILTASYDGTIVIWNSTSGEQLHKYDRMVEVVTSAMFSPDGQNILLSDGKSAQIRAVATGELILQVERFRESITQAVFSPSGEYFATIGYSFVTFTVWHTATGEPSLEAGGPSGDAVSTVAYSFDGRRIATNYNSNPINADWETNIYDTETGNFLQRLYGHHDAITSATFSPDGLYLLTTSMDHTAILWERNHWELRCVLGTPGTNTNS